MAMGLSTIAAENILKAPNSPEVSRISPFLIRIKELPHINVSTNIKFFENATTGFDIGYDIGNFNSTGLDI